ncbi:hypothetical protein [Halopiger xanaduensis]|uniref:Uncharacterized protein n=1 Tax=Halopiger xanaduensis (strain DSM 18323 / JCM 14033 / SH-6) TaxID=797210 RepID=F8D4M9_HALXS|nr:hypothetical protein [Halopiger xanaduensis]AEH36359.1 hypothetical protein Halxa_1730 [Halopiger xanaduensis SH-6]
MRRSLVIAAVVVAVAFLFVGGPSLFFTPASDEVASDPATESASEPEPELVSLEGSDSRFWPYLSAQTAHEKRSPINVIVRGETDQIVRLLAEHGDGDWNETAEDHLESGDLVDAAENETETENETIPAAAPDNSSVPPPEPNATAEANGSTAIGPTSIPWSQADGATRYAYLDPGPDEEGYWTTETLQLEDGEYYGHRYHIRAYESPNPDDRWIVMQTHSEHFDWFTLRHRVHGSAQAQARLEADLMAIPGVDVQEDVQRIYLGNARGSDADGWATRVDLTAMAILPVALGLAARRDARSTTRRERFRERVAAHVTETDRARLAAAAERVDARHLVLAATILAIVLGVRIAGIALDRTVDAFTAHMIAGLLYPVIAVGLPVAAYAIASGLERRLDAALAASLSLAAAIWLDYALLGVDVLPVDVVLQRMLVVAALGLIAGSAAGRATRDGRLNDLLVVGAVGWIAVLAGTLLGYL